MCLSPVRGLSSVLSFVPCVSRAIAALLVALLAFGFASPAAAAEKASIVVDLQSGKVLEASDPDSPRFPASLTKVMTLYLLFQDVEAGRVRMSDKATVSAWAARQPPSKLGLKEGTEIAIGDAVKALVTKSANDMAVVVAERLEGSVEAFATRMTATARALGMSRTTFRNASGLPDPEQQTTARDLALLGTAIQQHFPEHYKLFSTRSFRYGNKNYRNHNRLLGRVEGIDGIKTGYTRASGYNLLTSFRRDGRHLVAVVLGHRTGRMRDKFMQGLITASLPKASKQPVNPILVAKVPRVGGTMVAAAPALQPVVPQVAAPQASQPQAKVVAPVSGGDASAEASPLPPSASALSQPQPLPPAVRSKAKAAATAAKVIPAPTPRPDTQTVDLSDGDTVAQVSVPDSQSDADSKSKSSVKVGAWTVQVGVSPTESGAASLLDSAKEKAEALLAGAAPMTEKIESDDKVRYRARFAGLDRAAAQEVCKILKKNDLGCFTTRN